MFRQVLSHLRADHAAPVNDGVARGIGGGANAQMVVDDEDTGFMAL